ncbi:Programmed cell death protein 5 [Zea mays]|uniref:Programmed cell death protein 5 n=1 Tax=Zea mays TaxID=4577 RepID=A0A1D6MBN2_MAIZE|nr:Programmed cell death protein 5 [Zea mays]
MAAVTAAPAAAAATRAGDTTPSSLGVPALAETESRPSSSSFPPLPSAVAEPFRVSISSSRAAFSWYAVCSWSPSLAPLRISSSWLAFSAARRPWRRSTSARSVAASLSLVAATCSAAATSSRAWDTRTSRRRDSEDRNRFSCPTASSFSSRSRFAARRASISSAKLWSLGVLSPPLMEISKSAAAAAVGEANVSSPFSIGNPPPPLAAARWRWMRCEGGNGNRKKIVKRRSKVEVSHRRKSDQDVPIGRRGEEFSDRTAEMGRWGGKARAKTGRGLAFHSTHAEKKEKGSIRCCLIACHSSPRTPSPLK